MFLKKRCIKVLWHYGKIAKYCEDEGIELFLQRVHVWNYLSGLGFNLFADNIYVLMWYVDVLRGSMNTLMWRGGLMMHCCVLKSHLHTGEKSVWRDAESPFCVEDQLEVSEWTLPGPSVGEVTEEGVVGSCQPPFAWRREQPTHNMREPSTTHCIDYITISEKNDL